MRRASSSAIFADGGCHLKLACSALILLIASTGCKSPTPAEQLQTVGSWLATADMTAQAWLNHTTPEKYTRETLDISSQTIARTTTELDKTPPADLDIASLDSLLTRSGHRVRLLERMVAGRDAPAVRLELDSLRIEEKLVRDLAERLKAKQ